jgi:excisionase family DNA binding protein
MEKLLLKPAEVCALVGVGKSKVYELLAAGVIPSVRVGKSVRIPADRLRRWVEELQGDTEPPKTRQKGVNPSKPAHFSD